MSEWSFWLSIGDEPNLTRVEGLLERHPDADVVVLAPDRRRGTIVRFGELFRWNVSVQRVELVEPDLSGVHVFEFRPAREVIGRRFDPALHVARVEDAFVVGRSGTYGVIHAEPTVESVERALGNARSLGASDIPGFDDVDEVDGLGVSEARDIPGLDDASDITGEDEGAERRRVRYRCSKTGKVHRAGPGLDGKACPKHPAGTLTEHR